MFKEALQEARTKDAEKARGGDVEGVFWGLPSSFKGEFWMPKGALTADTYNIVGVDTSLGCSP